MGKFKRIDTPRRKSKNESTKTTQNKSALQLAEIALLDEMVVANNNEDKENVHENSRSEKIKQARTISLKRNERKTDKEIQQAKTEQLMNIIAERASYYRANPHRFVEEFLGIHLKLFQKILIYAMMVYDYFFFIAARGLGKTYLVSLFAVIRCILYPGTKIMAFSYTFKQGKEVVLKITDDFMQHSPLLCNEIKRASTGLNDCGVWFKNGSWIQVRVAGESARGKNNIYL